MGITTVTEKERHLANILRTTTEALQAVTAERDAQRKVLEQALEALSSIADYPEHDTLEMKRIARVASIEIQEQLK